MGNKSSWRRHRLEEMEIVPRGVVKPTNID